MKKIVIQAGLKKSSPLISFSVFKRYMNMIVFRKSSQHKIFNSVIIFNSVNMMNKLPAIKKATKFLFHCKTTTLDIGKTWHIFYSRVLGTINQYISTLNYYTPVPRRGFISNLKLTIVTLNKTGFFINSFKLFLTSTLTDFCKLFSHNYSIIQRGIYINA